MEVEDDNGESHEEEHPVHAKGKGSRKERMMLSKTIKRGFGFKQPEYLPEDDDVILDGFMYIRLEKRWKRKWFRLFNDHAEYANDVRKPPVDSLPITANFRVLPLVTDTTLMNNRPYNFVLSENRRAFFIAADSQKIKDFWLYVLKKLVEARKNNQELSPQFLVPIELVENHRDSSTSSGKSSSTRGSKGANEEEAKDRDRVSGKKKPSALRQMEQAVQELESVEHKEPEYQNFDPQDEEQALLELYEGTETETETEDDEARTVKTLETEGNENGSTSEEETVWPKRRSQWSIETDSINENMSGEGHGKDGTSALKPAGKAFQFGSRKNAKDMEEKQEEEDGDVKEPIGLENAYDSSKHLPMLNSFEGVQLDGESRRRRGSSKDEEKSLDIERDDDEELDVHLMGYREASTMLGSGLDTKPNSLEKRNVLKRDNSLILRTDRPHSGPQPVLNFGSDSEEETLESARISKPKTKTSRLEEKEEERRNSFKLVDDSKTGETGSARRKEGTSGDAKEETKQVKPRRKFIARAKRNKSESSVVSGLVGMYEERRKSGAPILAKIDAEKEIEVLSRAAREKSRAMKRKMEEQRAKEEAEQEEERLREIEREKEREIERAAERELQREERRKSERKEFIARLNKVPPPPPPMKGPNSSSGSQGFAKPSKLFEPLQMPKTVESAAPLLKANTNTKSKFVSIQMARQLLDSLDEDDNEEEKQDDDEYGAEGGDYEHETTEDRKSRRMINLSALKRKSLFKEKKSEDESFDAEILALIGEDDLLGNKSFSTLSAGSHARGRGKSDDTEATDDI